MSPERSLHTVVQPQRSIPRKRLLDHITRTRIRARLVLQSDLDQFERRDHKGFRSTGCATGDDGQGLGHGCGAVRGEHVAPVRVGGDCEGFRMGLEQA